MRLLTAVLVTGAALLPVTAFADLQAGNWELAVTTMMTGSDKPAAVTQTRCIREEDARDPSRVLGSAQGTCEFTNKNDSGSTFSFDVSCTGALPMKGKGTVHYTSTTMDADLDLAAGQGFGMRTFMKGRRLGSC
jgi:hypothetical protein